MGKKINAVSVKNPRGITVFDIDEINGIQPLSTIEKAVYSDLSMRSDFYDGFKFKTIRINGVEHGFYLNDYHSQEIIPSWKIKTGEVAIKDVMLTTHGFVKKG